MRRPAIVTAMSLAALAAPSAAQAQLLPGPAPKPAPAPAAQGGKADLSLRGGMGTRRADYFVSGQTVTVVGSVSPFVNGQVVTVGLRRGRRLTAAKRVAVGRARPGPRALRGPLPRPPPRNASRGRHPRGHAPAEGLLGGLEAAEGGPLRRRTGLARPEGAAAAARPAAPGLRRPGRRRLRRRHRPRGAGLPQDQQHAPHHRRQREDLRARLPRTRRLPGAPPARRLPRRVRLVAPGARLREPRPPRGGLPLVLRRALDADGLRPLPLLPQAAGHQRQGHGALELLHRRLRHPRLQVRADLPRQPRLPAGAHPEREGDRQSHSSRDDHLVYR